MPFIKINRAHPLREEAEACIIGIYADQYDATLRSFPNLLVALVDDDGDIACAAGLRFQNEGFFSEAYLDKPIERTLDPLWASAVTREQIGEITSLAGSKPGGCLLLVQHIIDLFRSQGVTWAFFTATERLRAILRRSGVPHLDVAEARIDNVDNPEQWGTYYDSHPRVVAVHDAMLTIVPPADAVCGEVASRA